MDLEGPRGPDLVPTAADWSAWLGIIVPHTLWPGIKPLLAPRSPKRACFGPKCPFWGSWKDSEGPREPDSVPTATGCSAYVGLMVGGLFLAARGPKSPRFSSECPFFGPCGPNMGPKIKIVARKRLDTRPKFVVTMSPAQAQQPEGVGTLRGPPGLPKEAFWAKTGILGQNGPFWGPWGTRRGPLPGQNV